IRPPAPSREEETRAGLFGLDPSKHRLIAEGANDDTVVVMETNVRNGPWAAGGFATVRDIDLSSPSAAPNELFGSNHHEEASGFQRPRFVNALTLGGSVRPLGVPLQGDQLARIASVRMT